MTCRNAAASGMVSFSTSNSTRQAGWAGSNGEDKCACGVNGNCAGGKETSCHCDMQDDVDREDGGTIFKTERLPVTKVGVLFIYFFVF